MGINKKYSGGGPRYTSGVSPRLIDDRSYYYKSTSVSNPSSEYYTKVETNDPDPFNFKIKKIVASGLYVLLMVNYPDATNYEGNKVLLMRRTDETVIDFGESLDPHFLGTPESPIARFEPTDFGWELGIQTMKFLVERDSK